MRSKTKQKQKQKIHRHKLFDLAKFGESLYRKREEEDMRLIVSLMSQLKQT